MARARVLGRVTVIVLAAALFGSADVATAGAADARPAKAEPEQACIPRAECCKVCSAGKACGNSCISRDYQCHKGRGCACDADEIC